MSADPHRSWDGLVVVDKPTGLTSHDVVARVRRLAGTRRVGHAGTLDPMATGVLVLGVNRATRLLGHLTLTDKVYDATIRLGAATSTDDAEGDVLSTASTVGLTEVQVLDVLDGFVGEIDQVPSSVSAIKVGGRRAYELVRAGEHVDLPSRRVRVDAIEARRLVPVGADGAPLAADDPTEGRCYVDVDVTVRCSSGTYVRAIARDLGERLRTGGHLTALRRTAVGPFDLAVAHTLEDLAEELTGLAITEAARTAFPARELDDEAAADVRFGRALDLDLGQPGPVAVFAPDGSFLALYEQQGERARAVAVFG